MGRPILWDVPQDADVINNDPTYTDLHIVFRFTDQTFDVRCICPNERLGWLKQQLMRIMHMTYGGSGTLTEYPQDTTMN